MRALPFGEGFVDISMYVAHTVASKNTACMRPDLLRRIFRKIRLAVFCQFCRLPIGLGSLRAGTRGCFPILRCRMSGIENRIVAAAAGIMRLPASQSQAYSGLFLAGCPARADKSGKHPASLATHRAGRAYYIYVASHNARQGILAGDPNAVLAD